MATVITGKYKGRKFFSANNPKIRPTQGRVKKSMMEILEPFKGRNVLDLYSGIGTLGIEALSRGALSVTFVENYSLSMSYLKKNINYICSDEKIKIIQEDVTSFLSSCGNAYDIVLADPPYKGFLFSKLHMQIKNVLSKDGKFCIEMKRQIIENDEEIRIKYYGNTQVVFGWKTKK